MSRRAVRPLWLARGVAACLCAAALLLSARLSRGVSLAWDADPGSGIGYRLYYGPASRTYTQSVDVGTATNTTVSGLVPGVPYFFAVTAYNSSGLESGFSSEVSYTVPSPSNPPSIVLTAPANGTVLAAPASIFIAATVVGNGNVIEQVQFYSGKNLLAQSKTPPHEFAWTNVSAGNYVLTAVVTDLLGQSVTSAPVSLAVTNPAPVPATMAYVTETTPGTLRNQYSGFMGMEIRVGITPLTVTALGRMVAPGNGQTHVLKLVNAADGTDLPGGSVSIDTANALPGRFEYGALPHPLVLAPGTDYYLVSQELAGADAWYYDDTTVETTSTATEMSAVWGYLPGQWHLNGSPGQTFGPVDFKYLTNSPPTPQTYVTSLAPGTLRNGYSGFLGMQFQVGAAPITVTALGRFMVPGNTGTHLVKLVDASDGSDVPGASVEVDLSAGTAGQFQFAPLAQPVTLSAATSYYLLSQENAGGDYWYYDDATLQTTSAAADLSAAWGFGRGQWHVVGSAGHAYGPVNFQYDW